MLLTSWLCCVVLTPQVCDKSLHPPPFLLLPSPLPHHSLPPLTVSPFPPPFLPLSAAPQRLSTTSVPFTVLSMSHNPCNEEFMIICGLKVRWEVEEEKREFKELRMCTGSYKLMENIDYLPCTVVLGNYLSCWKYSCSCELEFSLLVFFPCAGVPSPGSECLGSGDQSGGPPPLC